MRCFAPARGCFERVTTAWWRDWGRNRIGFFPKPLLPVFGHLFYKWIHGFVGRPALALRAVLGPARSCSLGTTRNRAAEGPARCGACPGRPRLMGWGHGTVGAPSGGGFFWLALRASLERPWGMIVRLQADILNCSPEVHFRASPPCVQMGNSRLANLAPWRYLAGSALTRIAT